MLGFDSNFNRKLIQKVRSLNWLDLFDLNLLAEVALALQ